MPSPGDRRANQPRSNQLDRRPIIAFMSDLGIADDSVGLCKGQMLTICPDAQIIDICHTMKPFEVEQGTRLVGHLPRSFPAWTTFATTILPEPGTKMHSVALRVPNGQIYIAPNNGLLTSVIDQYGFTEAFEVTSPKVIPAEPEPPFFSREMVAIPSAHVAAGFPISELGRELPDEDIVRIDQGQPHTVPIKRSLRGILTDIAHPYRDRWTNAHFWTNVHYSTLEEIGLGYGKPLRITVADVLTFDLVLTRTFGDRPLGAPVAYLSSRGFLALAQSRTDAPDTYTLKPGMPVTIESHPTSEEAAASGSREPVGA